MGKLKDKLKQIGGSAIVRGALRSLPFGIGSMAGGILDETAKSKAGSISKDELIPQLVKLGFYIVLAYLVLKGTITMEDAETAKEILAPTN